MVTKRHCYQQIVILTRIGCISRLYYEDFSSKHEGANAVTVRSPHTCTLNAIEMYIDIAFFAFGNKLWSLKDILTNKYSLEMAVYQEFSSKHDVYIKEIGPRVRHFEYCIMGPCAFESTSGLA